MALCPLRTIKTIETQIEAVAPGEFDEHVVSSKHMVIVTVTLALVIQTVKGSQIRVYLCTILPIDALIAVAIAHHRSEIDVRGRFVAGESVRHIYPLVACQFAMTAMDKLATTLKIVLAFLLVLAVVLVFGQRN